MSPRLISSVIIKFLLLLIVFFTLRAFLNLDDIDTCTDFYKDINVRVSYEHTVLTPEEEASEKYSIFQGINYTAALQRIASPDDKVAIIALIDWGFIDMVLNFYETSLRPHGIENYLFLASDERSCVVLTKVGISCYVYIVDEAGKHASEYHRWGLGFKIFFVLFFGLEIKNVETVYVYK